MSFSGLLNKKINIEKVIRTAVGDGSYTESWSIRYANVPCRINSVRMDELQEYDKQTVFADYIIFIEYKNNITEKDRIIFGSRTFEIKAVRNYDEMQLYYKIYVLEIKD